MKKNMLILICCCLLSNSCIYDVADPAQKRDIKLDPDVAFNPAPGVSANGVDLLGVTVLFPKPPNMDSTAVSFSVNEGVFFENNKPEYNTSDIFRVQNSTMAIYARIKSTTNAGMYSLTIKMPNGYKRIIPFYFLPAYPDIIAPDENKFAVKAIATDEIQLIANVKSGKGFPSKGTPIEFIVADTISSKNSRWFRGLTATNAEGQASVFFSPGSLGNHLGQLNYKAVGQDKDKKPIVGNGTFDVIKP